MNMQIRGGLTAAHAAYGRKDSGDGDDSALFKELSEALAARDKEIQAFATKADSEIKDHGKILSDTKAVLENLAKDGNKLQARLTEVEQKLSRRGGAPGEQRVKSVGEQFAESEEFKAKFPNGSNSGNHKLRIQVKAVGTISRATTGTGAAGAALVPQYIPGIITPPNRPLTIKDLLQPGSTGQSSIVYVRETNFQNNAAVAPEGTKKKQSDITLEQKSVQVQTIAHFFKVTKQALDDVSELASYINGRAVYGLDLKVEQELLTGDGTGAHLFGLLPQATPFDNTRRKVGDTPIDTVRRAISQVRVAEYAATGIVMNPIDWADIELQKSTQGEYIWSNPTINNGKNLWGLPVIDTNAMPEDEFMIGAFAQAAQVFDRQLNTVEVSTENVDDFENNLATIRAECRLALAVYRPESFVHGAFTPAG